MATFGNGKHSPHPWETDRAFRTLFAESAEACLLLIDNVIVGQQDPRR
jgi:hypothetical protein